MTEAKYFRNVYAICAFRFVTGRIRMQIWRYRVSLLGGAGWGRVDFLMDAAGHYLLEMNTVPGMTDHTLQLWQGKPGSVLNNWY